MEFVRSIGNGNNMNEEKQTVFLSFLLNYSVAKTKIILKNLMCPAKQLILLMLLMIMIVEHYLGRLDCCFFSLPVFPIFFNLSKRKTKRKKRLKILSFSFLFS